ncbi:MAG TPA: site-2 protease family protein [Gemmataceae bacterium]|nr:site-2 protease family protein [Gemmataceae bacterium]
MVWSSKLGRFFGIDVYLHLTFWLLPAWAFWVGLQAGGAVGGMLSVALVLLAFGCILLHEYGHALTARYFGIPTRDITLYPLGGVARLERLGNNAWEEFLIALAGPAVNVVLALLLAGGLLLMNGTTPASSTDLAGDLMFELLIANVIFVVFNLIPAFPMDGGRILRALLVPSKGYLRATEIAARTGGFFSSLFMLAGLVALFYPMPFLSWWLIPVGFFVSLMGKQELAMVRYREYQRRFRGFHFDEEPVTVQPADGVVVKPVEAHAGRFTGYLWDEQARRWVEWRNGQPVHGLNTGS